MTQPMTVRLDQTLLDVQSRWFATKDRSTQDELYAREFAPAFARVFRELPLHGAPAELPRPTVLISVLGLSWQPVALMGAWIAPRHMLVLGTKESFDTPKDATEAPLERIRRISGVAEPEWRVVTDVEVEIYEHVRDFVRLHGLDPRTVAVDPTGGKKSMSVSAGLAGFLIGCQIVYVDYAEYANRIPVAGTEFPRLLANPLEVLGDLDVQRIDAAFDRGDFPEAEHRARELASRLTRPRQVEARAELAKGYGAWDGFRFDEAHESLENARALLERFGAAERWSWTRPVRDALERHLPLLAQLEAVPEAEDLQRFQQGLPLVRNHLAAAERALAKGRLGIAILLAYSSLERHVDLCLLTDHGLKDEHPDYDLVRPTLIERREAFDAVGRALHGKGYRPEDPAALAGPVSLSRGLHLLATLQPETVPIRLLPRVNSLMSNRNKCEYEHGIRPKALSRDAVRRDLDLVLEIVSQRDPGVRDELRAYELPRLQR